MREILESNVCVIGGAGFIGSHLVDYLIDQRHCRVLVLDNLVSGQKKHIHEQAEFKWYDIRNPSTNLESILVDNKIEYVFNYAAEPYIPECFDNPSYFFNVNAVGVLNVLNACENSPCVKAVLQVSSAEIYGDMKGQIKESDFVEPHSTYGVAKLAADNLVQVRWKEAEVPAIALRQFNCVGPRETHEYVIPEIISQLHESDTIQLGNNSSRDFLYVKDAVKMAVELLEKGEFGEVYNMGSEDTISIYDLARLIGDVMGIAQVNIETEDSRVRPWEIWHLQSDNTKLHNTIEARPEVTLRDGLMRTVDYFKSNGNRWDW